MEKVALTLNEEGIGSFYILDAGERIGEMFVSLKADKLKIEHTEVNPKAQGKGVGTQLFKAMIDYVREHHLHIIPICPFTLAILNRNPDAYKDIWEKRDH